MDTLDWREITTLAELAVAQHEGDIIEVNRGDAWRKWCGSFWAQDYMYRARSAYHPKKDKKNKKKKPKQVVLRKALIANGDGRYFTLEGTDDLSEMDSFIEWLPGETTVDL